MNRQKAFDALDFEDQPTLNHHVKAKTLRHVCTAMDHWQGHLSLCCYARAAQFFREARLVDRFEQPGPSVR
jgi:hypothetical protein